ncbi:TetR family transcriptional regulator [Sphingobacterium allocomposti]|jgi:TetR/AcrR family transcriptional regulator|uniref:TetR family transcriptional regulator n=1 Tax=Sphingobacterium allocomposti TaxID=415956 RepID=A0A5S5DR22_9SPHI|nr:TetR/AcrR family transcriptional regulator [Sphingobacterium composti Yoo et al. 2007 non Ten et al. 2007]TYP97312.1 TetR family transcriptional regulator [Sphingobacterium composti Yoo et al. 2007 non Ten et al. 2007]HLS96871.1 TetR/AcrR family transcriptional regulator [Sphingobacterium sp.]
MSKNVDIKRAKILEVAKRRFAHFGMAKTTMAEIAKDLSFSKALLYYYFPDKHSLYTAVLEYVINEMINKVDTYMANASDVEHAILFAIESRMETMRENYNLFEYSSSLFMQNPGELGKNLGPFFDRVRDQFSRILAIGVNNKEIVVDDVEETAELLLFSLMGMRTGVLSKDLSDCLFPTPGEFDLILSKQKRMVKIFIRGLRP